MFNMADRRRHNILTLLQTVWLVRGVEGRFKQRGDGGLHGRDHGSVWPPSESSRQFLRCHGEGAEEAVNDGLLHRCTWMLRCHMFVFLCVHCDWLEVVRRFHWLNNWRGVRDWQAVPGQTEAELPNGLIAGHAYSITDVRTVSTTMSTDLDIVFNSLQVLPSAHALMNVGHRLRCRHRRSRARCRWCEFATPGAMNASGRVPGVTSGWSLILIYWLHQIIVEEIVQKNCMLFMQVAGVETDFRTTTPGDGSDFRQRWRVLVSVRIISFVFSVKEWENVNESATHVPVCACV